MARGVADEGGGATVADLDVAAQIGAVDIARHEAHVAGHERDAELEASGEHFLDGADALGRIGGFLGRPVRRARRTTGLSLHRKSHAHLRHVDFRIAPR